MARSIWTQEERDLLAPYVAQYKHGDEDSRILLLEHKVIPKFLAKFPPMPAETDADETEHHEGDLREVQRQMKQKIRGWFIKKAPTSVGLTPRRKPRARGDPQEREVLKHYTELYRVGTEQSRKILLTTRVLPEYIRQFHPHGNINMLSQKQKSDYKKHVRDWLTIEAYHRDEGEQDPEHGLHLSLDTIPHSESEGGESPSASPSPSIRRKRRISPSRNELPSPKKQKTSPNTTMREPAGSTPRREARSTPNATPRRPAARSSTPPRESAVSPSPPQTPLSKSHFAQNRRHNARNIVYSTAVTGSSEAEEGSEPGMESEPEPELEEDGAEAGSEPEPEPELEPEYDPDAGPEYEVAPQPQSGTASPRKSRFRPRSRSPPSSPQVQQGHFQKKKNVEDQAAEDQDQEEEERMMPLQEEETLREDVVMVQDSDEEDVVMQDNEDMTHEEDQDDDLEDREEEKQPQPKPKRRLRKRPVAAAPPIDLTESEDGDRTLRGVASTARDVAPLGLSSIGQHIRGPLYDQLKEVLTPLFHQQILAVLTEFTAQGPPQMNRSAAVHSESDGHAEHHKDNRRNQEQVAELEKARQEIQELKQQKNSLGSHLAHMFQNTSNLITGLETQCHSLTSQVNRLSKSIKDLGEGLTDIKGRKSMSRRARDSTARTTGGAGAGSSSAHRTQPAAVEALVGRFRKVVGAQVTVTYYLAKLPKRPLEEAVWCSLDDFVRLPNSAIILGVFHAQAEAEGLHLSNTRDDYVYLRDAILAGWDSDGTVHRRA